MTVREVIRQLQEHDLDDDVHIYAGPGHTVDIAEVSTAVNQQSGREVVVVCE